MRCRLGIATGTNRGLDEIHEDSEGVRNVRREGSGRANLARLLVRLLEVTSPERGERSGLPGTPVTDSDPSWSGPLEELVAQLLDPIIVAPHSRENDLQESAWPGQVLVSVGLAHLDRFVDELLGFIPPACLEIVVGELEHGGDPRCDGAALTRVADNAPEGVSTSLQPIDVGGRGPDPDDLLRVRLVRKRGDRRVECLERTRPGVDRISKGLAVQDRG